MDPNNNKALDDAIRDFLDSIDAEEVPPRVLELAEELSRRLRTQSSGGSDCPNKPDGKDGSANQ